MSAALVTYKRVTGNLAREQLPVADVTLPVTRPCPIPSPACVMLLHCLVTRQAVNTEAFGRGVGSAYDREREAAYRLRKQVRGSCLPACKQSWVWWLRLCRHNVKTTQSVQLRIAFVSSLSERQKCHTTEHASRPAPPTLTFTLLHPAAGWSGG